jgi:stalled ribosome rescue protein Dom34
VKKLAGLWIDHRKAVIVMVTEEGEETTELSSNMEKHVRFKGGTASEDGSKEDVRDRQFENHLNSYYDGVIAAIRDADSIQIFGPGEAKGELRKRLEQEGLKSRVLAIETADKMTDRQIAAKVREHFLT